MRRALQAGFTLLETIVAFGLLAVALTLLLAVFARAQRQMQWSKNADVAMAMASNWLSEHEGSNLPLGRHHGRTEQQGFDWQLDVAPFVPSESLSGYPAGLNAWTLTVQWADDPQARIVVRTLRPSPLPRRASP